MARLGIKGAQAGRELRNAMTANSNCVSFPFAAEKGAVVKRIDLNAFFWYDGARWQSCDPPLPPTNDEAYTYHDGWWKVVNDDEAPRLQNGENT